MNSESSMVKDKVNYYISSCMSGLDLGFGGYSTIKHSINVDFIRPNYGGTNLGDGTQHLFGSARDLVWFKDDVLDYVFSSHLLEDFPDTAVVLKEWIRVLKPGGLIILYLPNEMRFRAHCAATGQGYNQAHQVTEMSLEYMKSIFDSLSIQLIHGEDNLNIYSFLIVGKKE